MKEGNIRLCREPICWDTLPVFDIAERVRPQEAPVQARAQICRTENAFHIRLQAEEAQILAREQGPLAMPCNDSCLEFFLRPTESLRYMNFEWNPGGALYLGIGTGPADLLRIVPAEWQIKKLFAPSLDRPENSWQVTFQIPYSFIRGFFPDFAPEKATHIYGNFYKCGDKLDKPHYFAWNPILREGQYLFHTPEEFGKLNFV